jgi:hypothetical protein
MAENVTLGSVSSFQNDATASNIINTNNTTITTAFADCLSLSGVSPNQMQSSLDMNSNQILNLPPPASINSPARLVDVVTNPTITVPPVFTGSGAPTLSAAKGSLYLRTDGSSTSTRVYVNTNGTTGWTNLVSAT